jgi:hypothetical protein
MSPSHHTSAKPIRTPDLTTRQVSDGNSRPHPDHDRSGISLCNATFARSSLMVQIYHQCWCGRHSLNFMLMRDDCKALAVGKTCARAATTIFAKGQDRDRVGRKAILDLINCSRYSPGFMLYRFCNLDCALASCAFVTPSLCFIHTVI